MGWEEVGSRVYFPMWEQAVRHHSACLSGVTVDSLPDQVNSLLASLARAIAQEDAPSMSPEERIRRSVGVLGAALACALTRIGWSIRAVPGELALQGPSVALEPFEAVHALVTGKLDGSAWARRCAEIGIAGFSLMGDPAMSSAREESRTANYFHCGGFHCGGLDFFPATHSIPG